MGIWEFLGSTAESVKRHAPDATPVKNACFTSYSYGCAAVSKVNQTDGINALRQWIPDDETKSKITVYSSKFAKHAGLYALQEGYKLIPGGVAFSKILNETVNDVKHENRRLEKLDLVKEKADVCGGGRKLIAGAEMRGGGGGGGGEPISALSAADNMNRGDVLRIFMMKEFIGTRFFDDLMVHEYAKGKAKKKPQL